MKQHHIAIAIAERAPRHTRTQHGARMGTFPIWRALHVWEMRLGSMFSVRINAIFNLQS